MDSLLSQDRFPEGKKQQNKPNEQTRECLKTCYHSEELLK